MKAEEKTENLKQVRKHVMAHEEWSPSMKLALLWLFEYGIQSFRGKDLYNGIHCTKVHWNNWLRPRMIEEGWVKRINRTHYEFFNITVTDIF
tara:strand:- start:287 stop:562 length:276 start_codon:yes stop_codon:yes gene_type:complete